MPYADKRIGIYCISTPNGSQYVGSSGNIFRRWAEHRRALRRGDHHSARLQYAWNKHGDQLIFTILEECLRNELNAKEQKWIDRLGAELNTTPFVNNVWVNPQTRAKLAIVHQSSEWREARRQIALRTMKKKWRAIECSNGTVYPSMTEAALAFGIKASGIAHLARTQRAGRLGVRFKFADEEWRDVPSIGETMRLTRLANGTNRHTEAAKAKMSAARQGWRPSPELQAKAIEGRSRPVIGTSLTTGEKIRFSSQREAARAVRPENPTGASAQICKVCYGIKKSAYGYTWHAEVANGQ